MAAFGVTIIVRNSLSLSLIDVKNYDRLRKHLQNSKLQSLLFDLMSLCDCNCYRVRMRVCVANFRSRDCPRGRENILLRTRRHFYIYEDLKCDLYHDVKDVINLRFARNRCLPFL